MEQYNHTSSGRPLLPVARLAEALSNPNFYTLRSILVELGCHGPEDQSPDYADAIKLVRSLPAIFGPGTKAVEMAAVTDVKLGENLIFCLQRFGDAGIETALEMYRNLSLSDVTWQPNFPFQNMLRYQLVRLLIDNSEVTTPKLNEIIRDSKNETGISLVHDIIALIGKEDSEMHSFIRTAIEVAIQRLDDPLLYSSLSALQRVGEVEGTGQFLRLAFYLCSLNKFKHSNQALILSSIFSSGSEALSFIKELRGLISVGEPSVEVEDSIEAGKRWCLNRIEEARSELLKERMSYDDLERRIMEQSVWATTSQGQVFGQVLGSLILGSLGADAQEAVNELQQLEDVSPFEIVRESAAWALAAILNADSPSPPNFFAMLQHEDILNSHAASSLKDLIGSSQAPTVFRNIFSPNIQEPGTRANYIQDLGIPANSPEWHRLELAKVLLGEPLDQDPLEQFESERGGKLFYKYFEDRKIAGDIYAELVIEGNEHAAYRAIKSLESGLFPSAIVKARNLLSEHIEGQRRIEEDKMISLILSLQIVAHEAVSLAPLIATIVPTISKPSNKYLLCVFLTSIGHRALPDIKSLCRNDDPEVRTAAYRALPSVSLHSADSLRLLKEGLQDRAKIVRRNALCSITELPDSPPHLVTYVNSDTFRMGFIIEPPDAVKIAFQRIKYEGKFRLAYLMPTLKEMCKVGSGWLDKLIDEIDSEGTDS